MPDALAGPASVAVGWISTYLLHSTVLIGTTWLVTRFVRLQPKTRDLLWRVALLGGFVTAAGAMMRSPEPAELHLLRRTVEAEVRAEPIGWEGEGTPSTQRFEARLTAVSPECRTLLRELRLPTEDVLRRLREVCGGAPSSAWQRLVLLVGLVGAGLGLLAMAADLRALRSLRRSLRPAGPRMVRALRLVAGGTGRARAMTSPLLPGPCAMADGTIGLPERCEVELDDAELRAVLAHEVAHVERRDPSWAMLLRSVVAVAWMQPLNRLALRQAFEAAEEACDDWALTRTGERRGLASSISRVASWVANVPEARAAVSMAGRGGRAPSSRIRRILAGPDRPEPAWVRFAAVASVALPLLFVPAVPAPTPPRTAIFVEERGLLSEIDPGAVGSAEAALTTRVVVARIRSD